MLCYQCGNPLGSGRFCLRCGADVTTYRKIVRLSNRYYNAGLEKAKVRNLTGAAEDLTLSLKINKRNIQARNLLGLVYYELGETVQALCEWVISSNYQEEDNPAAGYVAHLQENRTELEAANQGIRKFNIALDYARKDSEDLAILQLEWVVSHHPHMVKAHALLALLYMWDGKNNKADKEIKTVLKQDRGNTFCLNLAKELAERTHTPQPKQRESLSSVIREKTEAVSTEAQKYTGALKGRPAFLLRILLGSLLLVCVFMGILWPTVKRRRSQAVSDAVAVYSEQMEALRSRLSQQEELSDAFAVFLKMSELDPGVPEDRAQLEELFAPLTQDRSADTLYQAQYRYWQGVLSQPLPEETDVPSEEASEENTDQTEGSENADNP
ncbi:MAG: hypothetical protein II882_04520 [Lachnospiraceae bacterium]|nr:hypothetical protein [Lachnospiraceae bacterium]